MAVSIGFFWPHFIKSIIAVKEFFYTQPSVLKFSKKKKKLYHIVCTYKWHYESKNIESKVFKRLFK